MQVADHKKSLERIKVVEMEIRVMLSAEPAQWALGNGGEVAAVDSVTVRMRLREIRGQAEGESVTLGMQTECRGSDRSRGENEGGGQGEVRRSTRKQGAI